ncbi:MAG TPA: hypothetical protein VLX68_07665 [Chitinivibrionales bacterium]|nr:hypothetical protein [Chitinivibrionales bacterium]
MKKVLKGLAYLNVFLLVISFSSCTSDEAKGNTAYNQAKHSEGINKRTLEKRAYIFYQKVYQAQPDKSKLSLPFRKKFIEMTLIRANMVLTEGTYDMDPLKLFIRDIDTLLTKELPSEIRQDYAKFLLLMADSSVARNKLDDALDWISKAQKVVDDPSSMDAKRKALITDFTKQFYEMAAQAYSEGKDSKDVEALLKAEYYVQLVLVYDPNYPGAADLLSNLRKANVSTYSGYARVIEGKLDPRVNKYDIYLAVKSGTTNMTLSMFNYSYNPLRLKAENFYLVDVKGEKYRALPSSKLDPEILDTQHETNNLKLVFPKPKAELKKVIYDNGEHYTEKCFF